MQSSHLVKELSEKSTWVLSPTVTIAIPALNEEKYIERVVRTFINSSSSNILEILIADGGSTDGTVDIVKRLGEEDKRVKLLHNPYRYQSAALNIMINNAKGELFLRADAHCEYSKDYVENSIMEYLRTGAKNVGGAPRYIATNEVQVGIALAVRSFLGNGGAKHHDPDFQGYSDTVSLGCYKTSELKKIKGFSLENVVNEDSELNLRLQNGNGRSIYVSKHIKFWYYPRSNFKSLFKQYFNYGRGRFITFRKHRNKVPNRSIAPFVFGVLFIAYLLFDLLYLNLTIWPPIIVGGLMAVAFTECAKTAVKTRGEFDRKIWRGNGNKIGLTSRIINCFVALQIMVVGHFLGFGYQFLKSFRKNSGF